MNSVLEADLQGKKVIVRSDLDVTITDEVISDDFRLQAILPTLSHLKKHAKQVLICGHLGRPKDQDPTLTLKPIHEYLEEALEVEIPFITDLTKPIESEAQVILLENLKYDEGETANDTTFAKQLASHADIYVNESFAVSHHDYASIVSVPKHLPSYCGLQLEKEVEALKYFWESKRPITFLLGGVKTDKLVAVEKLVDQADLSLVGGAFMHEHSFGDNPKVVYAPDSIEGKEIGPEAIALFKRHISESASILWNGALGKFEEEKYSTGTKELAQFLAEQADTNGLHVVAGGGSTTSALKKFGVLDKMSFVSTGGGAMIALLADGTLPGLTALES